MDPIQEYNARLETWRGRERQHDQWHRWLGNLRLLVPALGLLIGGLLCRSHVEIGFVFLVIIGLIFLSGWWHDRVLKAKEMAGRAARFCQAGLERLQGQWAGKGTAGNEFLDPHHPYAIDLDLFGAGSLFEHLNRAQTQAGQTTLAQWLLAPASPEEIVARQLAVTELRPCIELRQDLAVLAEDAQNHIRTQGLILWASQPPELTSKRIRLLAFCLPLVTAALFISGATGGRWAPLLISLVAQGTLGLVYFGRVSKVLRNLESPARDLKWLAQLFERLERESFKSARLRQLQNTWRCDGIPASQAIRRLAFRLDWLDSRLNLLFAPWSIFLLWATQFAFAIEAWRARFGPRLEPWLRALGEMEALSSLASYAFEQPTDPFPEVLSQVHSPLLAGDGLGHPLILESRCVRNDVLLDPQHCLWIVSGSNMSGKSTWLRTLGVNVVLALAGAPVRARKLRLTPLQIGASIHTVDSLQEGISRFYAEITRLRQIMSLTEQPLPVFYVLDEILGGTNSHDRRLGAAAIARSLIQRGAMGLITTHDLALARIADEWQPRAANYHFEDQLDNGRLSFDYCLRSGVVEKSNALELMRSVGLKV